MRSWNLLLLISLKVGNATRLHKREVVEETGANCWISDVKEVESRRATGM